MGVIPKYKSIVERNGVSIPFVRWEFVRDAGQVAPGWSVELEHPVNLSKSDTWTIKRGYGNFEQVLVNSATAENIRSSDGERSTRSVSGYANVSDLLEYKVPKKLVFINPDWLRGVDPSANIESGIIKRRSYYRGDYQYSRFYHPALPDRNTLDDEFQCFLTCKTHHDIGHYIANQLGYELIVNTPDVALLDSHTIEQGTSWIDAITENFRIWSPTVQVEDDKIYILDPTVDVGEIPEIQRYKIDNPAIISVSEDSQSGNNEVIDHLIVEGRPSKNSLFVWPREVDTSIRSVEPKTLEIHEYRVTPLEFGGLSQVEQLNLYSGSIGSGDDEFTPKPVQNVYRTDAYHIDEETEKRILVESSKDVALSDGSTVQSVRQRNWFGPNKEIVKTEEVTEGYVQLPGRDVMDWAITSVKTTFQNYQVNGLDMAFSQELVSELVMFEKEIDDDGAITNRLDPIPLVDFQRADKSRTGVDTNEDTTQEVMVMTTKYRWAEFEREDDKTLRQNIYDFDVLSGTLKPTTQTIQDPKAEDLEQNRWTKPFRKEYHPEDFDDTLEQSGKLIGTFGRCYHSPKKISHRDLTTETQLDAVAERFFQRARERRVNVTVESPVPIPFTTTAVLIELPAFTYTVNGTDVEVPGGTYVLRSVREQGAYGGDASSNEQEVNVRQTLTLRSNF